MVATPQPSGYVCPSRTFPAIGTGRVHLSATWIAVLKAGRHADAARQCLDRTWL